MKKLKKEKKKYTIEIENIIINFITIYDKKSFYINFINEEDYKHRIKNYMKKNSKK